MSLTTPTKNNDTQPIIDLTKQILVSNYALNGITVYGDDEEFCNVIYNIYVG